MRPWLATATAAARLVADRAELWIPASLASLAFVGWLPLVLAVVPLPDAAGLGFFASDLVSSGAWPFNVVLLAAAIVFGLMSLGLLVALGEAALQRGLRPLIDDRPASGARHAPDETLTGETAVTFVVMLLALLPAAAGFVLLAIGVVAVAPGEYQSPDIGGPVLLRIALGVAPAALLTLLLAVLGQAYGSAVQRRAVGPYPEPISTALLHGFGDLRRHPVVLLGTAVVTLLVLVMATLLSTLLLRVLWAPIGVQLRGGELASPQTVLLLVGFVAIWLCLVVAAGAIHAWASVWWSLELRGRSNQQVTTAAGEPGPP
jgi:hypothetical protein